MFSNRYIRETLKPRVVTEHQLVFLCHVFGPFLQRIEQEKPNAVAGIAILLYEMLEKVDKQHGQAPLEYMDPICDFLYHIKYIHVGNIIKNESEAIIKRLRPALQMRLRFISHLNIEDKHIEKPGDQNITNTSNNQQNPMSTQTLQFQSNTMQQNFSNLHNQQQQQQQAQQQGMQSVNTNLNTQSQPPNQQQQQQQQPQLNQQQQQLHQMQLQQQQQLQQQFQQQQLQLQHFQQQQQMQQQQQQSQASNIGGGMRHN